MHCSRELMYSAPAPSCVIHSARSMRPARDKCIALDRRPGRLQVLASSVNDSRRVLGVDEQADEKAIKKAFRRLALRTHPDHSKEPGAASTFLKIQQAYEALLGRSRGKEVDDKRPSHRGSWDFHDWYWQFSAKKRWSSKHDKSGQTAPTSSKLHASPASAAATRAQLDGLRRKAHFRQAQARQHHPTATHTPTSTPTDSSEEPCPPTASAHATKEYEQAYQQARQSVQAQQAAAAKLLADLHAQQSQQGGYTVDMQSPHSECSATDHHYADSHFKECTDSEATGNSSASPAQEQASPLEHMPLYVARQANTSHKHPALQPTVGHVMRAVSPGDDANEQAAGFTAQASVASIDAAAEHRTSVDILEAHMKLTLSLLHITMRLSATVPTTQLLGPQQQLPQSQAQTAQRDAPDAKIDSAAAPLHADRTDEAQACSERWEALHATSKAQQGSRDESRNTGQYASAAACSPGVQSQLAGLKRRASLRPQ